MRRDNRVAVGAARKEDLPVLGSPQTLCPVCLQVNRLNGMLSTFMVRILGLPDSKVKLNLISHAKIYV
jgi:hypothetical protein